VVVPPRILSLCTGLGGLDLGVAIAAPNARVVCAIERDAYCSTILAQSMEQGHIPQAPIWDDLYTFYGRPWRGAVDCVTAGYPCQPFSVAGQKRGAADARHLWPEVFRIIGECGPPLVFLENVARHLTSGFDVVARDLQGLGYAVAAMVCRASTVGAPHQRERLFALAVSDAGRERVGELAEWIELHAPERWDTELAHMGEGLADPHGGLRQSGLLESLRGTQRGDAIDGAGEGMGNANGVERDQRSGLRQSAGSGPDQSKQDLEHANVKQCLSRPGECGQAGPIEFGDAGCWPPGPADLERWATVPVEFWPSVESPVRGVAHGLPDGLSFRREQLHALGNAVVPVQAAYAFVTLVNAFAGREVTHVRQ
jgi:DNA (cytosine-5)-methyltransferase 1